VTAEEKLDRLSEQIGAVGVQLATLTGSVQALRSDLTRTATETAHDLADHELRLRTLEAWRWRVIGTATGIGLGSGALSGALAAALVHFGNS